METSCWWSIEIYFNTPEVDPANQLGVREGEECQDNQQVWGVVENGEQETYSKQDCGFTQPDGTFFRFIPEKRIDQMYAGIN